MKIHNIILTFLTISANLLISGCIAIEYIIYKSILIVCKNFFEIFLEFSDILMKEDQLLYVCKSQMFKKLLNHNR